MKKRLTMLVLIISLALFFGSIGNVIIMNTVENLSVANTTEFAATIKSVEAEGNGLYIIHSEEYGNKLSTVEIKEMTSAESFNSLKTGQTVFFRTKNILVDQFEKINFIPIVSLRTEGEEIVSLSKYNEHMKPLIFSSAVSGIIVALIFLLISIHCLLLLKGINILNKSKH